MTCFFAHTGECEGPEAPGAASLNPAKPTMYCAFHRDWVKEQGKLGSGPTELDADQVALLNDHFGYEGWHVEGPFRDMLGAFWSASAPGEDDFDLSIDGYPRDEYEDDYESAS